MKQILAFISIAFPSILFAQTSDNNNIVNTTGVTAIQSTTNANYQLSVGGAVKQFGAGLNLVGSPTLFLHNTTLSTGKQYGINSNDNGQFQIFEVRRGYPAYFTISNSNVGIGTASPQQKLDVAGYIQATGFVLPTNASAGKVLTSDDNGYATWQTLPGTGINWGIGGNTVGTLKTFGTVDNFDLPFITNSTEKMRLMASGKVGIGTAAPADNMEINGTNTALRISGGLGDNLSLNFGAGETVYHQIISNANAGFLDIIAGGAAGGGGHNIRFITDNVEKMRITYTGNIGIGTTTPSQKLEVAGNIKATGFIFPTGANFGKVLTSDSTGNASWQSINSGGLPGGSNAQVQFNNNGAFGGNSNLTWNGSRLNISGAGENGNSGLVISSSAPASFGNITLINDVANNLQIGYTGSSYPTYGNVGKQDFAVFNSGAGFKFFNASNAMGDFSVALNSAEKFKVSNDGTLKFNSYTSVNQSVDTANYKVAVFSSDGTIKKMYWPSNQNTNNSNWSVSGNNIYNANAGLVIIGNLPATAPTDPNLKLAVVGNISAQKLKITQSGWADYVFDSTYKLRPLQEVEKFIQQNQHLPEIPSAAEINKNGLDVGDNQVILLKKIEELTLYIISLDKKVAALEEENKRISGKNNNAEIIKKKLPIK